MRLGFSAADNAKAQRSKDPRRATGKKMRKGTLIIGVFCFGLSEAEGKEHGLVVDVGLEF